MDKPCEEKCGEGLITQSFVYLVSARGGNNFLARVLNGCDKVATERIETMGVAPTANGRFVLIYNPVWVSGLTTGMLKLVLIHEAAHICLRHHERLYRLLAQVGDRDEKRAIRAVFNAAADIAVNETVVRQEKEFASAVATGEWDGLEARNFGVPDDLSMEQYLVLLAKRPEAVADALRGGSRGHAPLGDSDEATEEDSGADEDSDVEEAEIAGRLGRVGQEEPEETEAIAREFDRRTGGAHREWLAGAMDLSSEELLRRSGRLRDTVKELMRAAWEQSVKARGDIPGVLERELAALVQADQVPWDVLLAEAIVAARRSSIVDAMATPNLALLAEDSFEPWPGHGLDPEWSVVWITDTSGSVEDAEYLRAIGVLNSLLAIDRRVRCRHILIDAAIEKEIEVDNLEGPSAGDHSRVGYGGTSYRGAFKRSLGRDGPEDWAPGAERCEEAPSPPDLVIVFTDGGVRIQGECFPEFRPACPIIWLVSPDAPSVLPSGMAEGQGDRVIRMASRG